MMSEKFTAKPAHRRITALILAVATVLAACAPGISPQEVQSQVMTGVAGTVDAQNRMATAVAATLTAVAPPQTATPFATNIPLNLPTLTPAGPTVTPFVAQPSGGGGGSSSKPKLLCDAFTVKPKDNTSFKPGDPFDIRWIITNVGTADMRAGLDFDYLSGPHLTNHSGIELPKLKPGDSYTFNADANAPMEKGDYVMTWKVEGGLCYPYVAITSGRPGDP
jgi:hypothetical protein